MIGLCCIRVDFNYVFALAVSEVKLEEAAVLHYTYAKFSDLTSRRDRCGCKPTKEDVKRCFMLEFDRSVSELSLSFYMCVFPYRHFLSLFFYCWVAEWTVLGIEEGRGGC